MADASLSDSSPHRASWTPRLGIAISLAVLGLGALLGFLVFAFRSSLIEARKGELERVVTIAARAIDPIVVDCRNGVIDRRAALATIGGELRSLARLGSDTTNYMFVIDYDGKDLEGPVLRAVESYPEPGATTSGLSPIAGLLIASARNGGGFVEYSVPLASGARWRKLSFVRGFDDLGFLIGTGFYMADLDRYALAHTLPAIFVAVVLAAVAVGLVFLTLRPFYLVYGRLRAGFSTMSADPGNSQPVSVEGFRSGSEPRVLLEDYNKMVERVVAYEGERSRAESLLLRDNDEKKVLLQEIHHRVKNNLQVIVSLLNLQAGAKSHEGCRSCIGEATGRIRSMATIHEILYESGDFSSLDFAAYTERIARTAAQTADVRCSLDLNLEPLHIGLEQAVPCGLIISEALTNALKYGRDGEGRVRVSMRLAGEKERIVVEVSDSGPGFPPDFEKPGGRGLGRTLMVSLAEQARGEIHFENRGGASVRLVVRRG